MILTVTLNPAIDNTYRVPALTVGDTNRVESVSRRAGGKGINVARVLTTLGVDVVAMGPSGGWVGAAIEEELRQAGVASDLFPIAGCSRQTVTIVDAAGNATAVNEPGPVITADEWSGFIQHFGERVGDADVVVLSGSVPPGLPPDAYAILVVEARRHGVASIVDSSGAPLREALAARPEVVKPNRDELQALVGRPLESIADVTRAAEEMRSLGAGSLVVSLAEEGLIAVTDGGAWTATPPVMVRGNPTGAGDAVVAALANGLARRHSWEQRLADAIALSAAAVAGDCAGDFDRSLYHRLIQDARVKRM